MPLVWCIIMIALYILAAWSITKRPAFFIKGIAPAHRLVFTSSSAATLPNNGTSEEHLGVHKQGCFVLPIGATIVWMEPNFRLLPLCLLHSFCIHLPSRPVGHYTATLASIGSAAIQSRTVIRVIVLARYIPKSISSNIAIERPLDVEL